MRNKEMMTVREAASSLGNTQKHVRDLLHEGKLAGARKAGNRWIIPAAAIQARLLSHWYTRTRTLHPCFTSANAQSTGSENRAGYGLSGSVGRCASRLMPSRSLLNDT